MLGPPPLRDPVVNDSGGALGTWGKWFMALRNAVAVSTPTVGATRLQGQNTSLATTPLATVTLSAGLYRLTQYVRVTRAATTSSSIQVTVLWTDNGVAMSSAGVAQIGNTTSTFESRTVTVRIDAMTTLRYSTTYASVGGTTMLYSVDILAEALQVPL